MSERRKNPLSAVVLVLLLRRGKVLLMRRQNTGWHDGDYDLIGGHVEGGETFREALVREIDEETGVKVEQENAHFVHLLHYVDSPEYVYAFFKVEKWLGEPVIMEPDKCDELRWFPIKALPENTIPATREAIRRYGLGEFYTEYVAYKQ